MSNLPKTQWALLMPDGAVYLGAGDGPSENVCGRMRESVASMWCFPELPRLFVVGPSRVVCSTDVNMATGGATQRVWSFGELVGDLGPERRLFVWSDGGTMGVGRTQEEVSAAVQAIQAASRKQNPSA